MRWLIVTGEYPPAHGGVSDYTRQVAQGLAAAGDVVEVFAPGLARQDGLVTVHGLPDAFGWQSCRRLSTHVSQLSDPVTMWVQYVPQSFGWRGMNLPFCLWLRRLKVPLWVMFHELWMPFGWRQSWRYNVLSLIQRVMAVVVAHRTDRAFASCSAFAVRLRPWCAATLLAVPSSLTAEASQAVAWRERLSAGRPGPLIGSFRTFHRHQQALLLPIYRRALLSDPQRLLLLVGRGSEAFAHRLVADMPEVGERILSTGTLGAADLGACLAACDLLLQPYPDGVSLRRTTTMAGLALGRPVVTNRGLLTEPCWLGGVVSLAAAAEPDAMEAAVQAVLRPGASFGAAGARFYAEHCALQHTLDTLRA